ncbi:MAG: hypothetical protein ACREQ5_27160 [Candidatus Dormibacteria bacterium]
MAERHPVYGPVLYGGTEGEIWCSTGILGLLRLRAIHADDARVEL